MKLKPPENDTDFKTVARHIKVIIRRFRLLPEAAKKYVLTTLLDFIEPTESE